MLLAKELFINISIFVTVLLIGSLLFQNTGFGVVASLKIRVGSGVINGAFGIILIIFSFPIAPGVLLDFRYMPIIVGSILFGWQSCLITGIILAIFRTLYLAATIASFAAGSAILIMAIGCTLFSLLKVSKKIKWICMFILCNITVTCFLYIPLENSKVRYEILLYYWIGGLLSNIVVYHLTEYLTRTHKTLKRLKEEATIDYLTGLNNTRSFDQIFNDCIMRAKENNGSIALLSIDIDYFKKINDTYGHPSGDAILRELGYVFTETIRNFDVVARVGGEEFSILLSSCDKKSCYEVAERIRRKVEAHLFQIVCGKKINITVSIGVAVYPATVIDMDMLKERADEKLYEAKHAGRNIVCI